MTLWIMLWALAAVVFLAIDMVWLLKIGRGFYVEEIGGILREQPGLAAAGAFYALYVTGLMIMVIGPALDAGSVARALLYGAVFGLVAYGTYDLTNLSVLKGFTARIAVIDMVWGMVLTSATSGITVLLAGLFGLRS
jgi:uncharacterized membrane protein